MDKAQFIEKKLKEIRAITVKHKLLTRGVFSFEWDDIEPIIRSALSECWDMAGEEKFTLFHPRTVGKITLNVQTFLDDCNKGKQTEYHAKDYVVLSRERYKALTSQKEEKDIVLKTPRPIVIETFISDWEEK